MSTGLLVPTSAFGFALGKQQAAEYKGQNIAYSPYGLSTAFSVVLRGAPVSSSTRNGILDTLGLPHYPDHLAASQAFAQLSNQLVGDDLGVRFTNASSIWAREGVSFSPEFIHDNQHYMQSEVRTEDFTDPNTVDKMNGWVSQKTDGMIPELVKQLDPATVMLILAANAFKGLWTDPFDVNRTKEETWYHPQGTKQHPLMMRYEQMSYGQAEGYQIAALPFGQVKRIKNYIILPDEDTNVEEVLSHLDGDRFWQQVSRMELGLGGLWLPRFEVRHNASLKDALSSMGMEDAFDWQRADFSDMLGGTFISAVQHNTYVKLTELGVEAASGTAIHMGATCVPPGRPFNLKVNRPFINIVADPVTQTLLFVSIVVDPVNPA